MSGLLNCVKGFFRFVQSLCTFDIMASKRKSMDMDDERPLVHESIDNVIDNAYFTDLANIGTLETALTTAPAPKRHRSGSPQAEPTVDSLLLSASTVQPKYGGLLEDAGKVVSTNTPENDPTNHKNVVSHSDTIQDIIMTDAPSANDAENDNKVETEDEIAAQELATCSSARLPPKVLEKIIQYALPHNDTITPWFKYLMNTKGIRGWHANGSNYSEKPNIVANILRVTKQFHEIGTDILYGTNHFRLNRADACLWWIETIGPKNLKKISMWTLNMESGWLYDRRDANILANSSEISWEETWFRILGHILRNKVKIAHMNVRFMFWPHLDYDDQYDMESKEELHKWRVLIMEKLGKFSDIETVKVEEVGLYKWIGEYELGRLEMMMGQG